MQSVLFCRGIFVPRPHARLCLSSKVKATNREEVIDYYDVLQVDPDASVGEIKFNFRKLQKQHHPDISGNEETSSVLNQAYQTLVDPNLRASYDRRLAAIPLAQREVKRSFKDQPGIVGPLSDAEIIMKNKITLTDLAANEVDAKKMEHATWLREWAKTFIFASDLPLPLPLQCDEVENGVRLAFITTSKNRIRSAGELHFIVEDDLDDPSNSHSLSLSVHRIIPSASAGVIPGEDRVMKAFTNAWRDKNELDSEHSTFLGFELSGFAASAAAQFLPALVTLPVEKIRGASYEAYHLRH